MLYLASAVAGILLGLIGGGSLRQLASARIRGEYVLLGSVAVQVGVSLLGAALDAEVAWLLRVVWCVSLAMMLIVVVANLQATGFPAVLAGILANAVVILANGAMPVSVCALDLAGAEGSPLSLARDAAGIHSTLGADTSGSILADIMPLAVPGLGGAIVSVGDVLLLVGVVAFVSSATQAWANE